MDTDQQPYTEFEKKEQQRIVVQQSAHEAEGRFKKGLQVAFYSFLKFLKSLIKAMARQFRGR